MERRELLETLISCSEERAYYRVLLVACACVYMSDVSMSVCLFVHLKMALVTPFIVEGEDRGGTCICYVVFCERRRYVQAL